MISQAWPLFATAKIKFARGGERVYAVVGWEDSRSPVLACLDAEEPITSWSGDFRFFLTEAEARESLELAS